MITAAADGSSLSNPGPAGWAWYVDDDCWAAGGWPVGTNNMGELMAVLDLLHQTSSRKAEALHVLCDSQYVINSVTKWMPGWKRKGWRKADGKPVMNRELLEELDAALAGRQVSFEWVKGHAGHPLNEAADDRARAAATAYKEGTPVPEGPGFPEGDTAIRAVTFLPSVAEEPDLFSAAAQPEVAEPELDQADPGTGTSHPVVRLTRHLLDNDTRADPQALAELLHPDYVEHDARGAIRTRGRALAGLPALKLTPQLEVIGVSELGPGLVQLRWRLRLGSRVYLNHSLWQRAGLGWQLRFAQSTPVEASS